MRLLGEFWDRRISAHDNEFAAPTGNDEQARKMGTTPGICVINTTPLVANFGNPSAIVKGSDLAAWPVTGLSREHRVCCMSIAQG